MQVILYQGESPFNIKKSKELSTINVSFFRRQKEKSINRKNLILISVLWREITQKRYISISEPDEDKMLLMI